MGGCNASVDPNFVRSIFSMGEICRDWSTSRKPCYYAIYLTIALVITTVMAALWDEICASIRYAISVTVVLAIFLYAVEPSVLLLQALIMSHPLIVDVPPPAATSLGAHQKDNPRIAVVIACHKSEDTIVATIRSCRNHFDDCQIFVMNNRNGPECLTESTRSVIDKHALHKVNYIYNPMGNKTLAFYAGAIAAKDFQYILLMDDDVHLPRHMSFDCNVFDEKVKAVCYPIRAVHPSGDDGSSSLFIQWQALEYKTSDYTKLLQSYLSTVLYPHGAISLWERETLIECLRQHDTIFYADDVKMGLWLTRQKLAMKMDHRFLIDTIAPISLLGAQPNLYQQRVRGWHMSEHAYTHEYVRAVLCTGYSTFTGTVALKWFQVYAIFCIFADIIRLPALLIAFMVHWRYTVIFMPILAATHALMLVLWDQVAYRKCPERKSPLRVLLTYPVYKLMDVVLRWLGMGRAYFVYLPSCKRKPTIPELDVTFATRVFQCHHAGKAMPPSSPVWLDPWDFDYGLYYRHYNPTHPAAIEQPRKMGEDACNSDLEKVRQTSECKRSLLALFGAENRARREITSLFHAKNVVLQRVQDLLQRYPSIATTKDTMGHFLLHTACSGETPLDLVRLVADASPRNPTTASGTTALHMACQNGADCEVIAFLGNKWPRAVQTADAQGRLPLHLASYNHAAMNTMWYLLLEHTPAVTVADQDGNLPLHLALLGSPSLNLLKLLVNENPATLRHENQDGDVPLHLACRNPKAHQHVPWLFCTLPVAAFTPNHNGNLPVQVAMRCRQDALWMPAKDSVN